MNKGPLFRGRGIAPNFSRTATNRRYRAITVTKIAQDAIV